MFAKKDLEIGMIAEFRNGRIFIVMPTKQDVVMVNEKEGYIQLSRYEEVLDCKSYKDFDVVKVWGLSKYSPLDFNVEGRTLLWEREEPKYYLRLPAGTFGEGDRYLNYSRKLQSYLFSTKDELKSLPGLKTKFTLEEANEVKNIIKSSIEVVEIKGE